MADMEVEERISRFDPSKGREYVRHRIDDGGEKVGGGLVRLRQTRSQSLGPECGSLRGP